MAVQSLVLFGGRAPYGFRHALLHDTHCREVPRQSSVWPPPAAETFAVAKAFDLGTKKGRCTGIRECGPLDTFGPGRWATISGSSGIMACTIGAADF